MTILLAGLIDATVILALGLALASALRGKSASVRHAVLTTAIVCATLMPVLELTVPQLPVVRWTSTAVVQSSGLRFSSERLPVVTEAATTTTSVRSRVSWPTLLAWLWAAGMVVTFTGLLISLYRLRRLRNACTPVYGDWRALTDSLARECGVRRPVRLLQSDNATLLVTCGLFRPGIILPAGVGDWTDDRKRIVLRHELAHIRRHDAAIQIAGELLRAMQPFNPLVWLACRRLRQESEYACDDAVLGAGVEATDYATHLFDVATRLSGRQIMWASAPAIANPSTLERRIVAMLQVQKNRRPLTRNGWTVGAVLAMVISLPLAAVGIAPQATIDIAPQANTEPNSPTVAPPPPVTAAAAPSKVIPSEGRVKVARPAQTSLSGQVQDQAGGRMPGATVIVTNQQTQAPHAALTNAAGEFQFVNLPPAPYVLAAELSGFRKRQVSVDLSSGSPANLVVTLEVGALSEEITVPCGMTSPSILQMFFPTLSAQERTTPVRVGGQIKPPRKVRDVRPVCPAGGTTSDVMVILEGHIGVDGFISGIKLLTRDDVVPGRFTDSVMDAVRQWEFTPTLLNGMPVEVTVTITVNFKGA